jgi:hypothetical protein
MVFLVFIVVLRITGIIRKCELKKRGMYWLRIKNNDIAQDNLGELPPPIITPYYFSEQSST